MDLTVRVVSGEPSAAVRSLRGWLTAEPALRGRVRLVEPAPPAGTLGGAVEALTVALSHGGAAAVLASAVVAWVRRRVGDTSVTVTRPDGTSVTVDATHVRGLNVGEVAGLVAEVARALDSAAEETGDGAGD